MEFSSELLNKAFRQLRKKGYFARRHWKCCQSCGWAEVPTDKSEKVVFLHRQDEGHLKFSGYTYMAWAGDGKEICEVLEENGVPYKWDGDSFTRIQVGAV